MSIQLSLDGLSFCVLDPVSNTFLALQGVRFGSPDPSFATHEEYMLRSPHLGRRFRQVSVGVESPAFTMLPTALYSEATIRQLLALTGINVRADDRVLRNDIALAGASTVFAVPNFLYFFLRTQFKGAEIMHATTPVVTSLLLKRREGEAAADQRMALLFGRDSLTLVAVARNELKLCNRFYLRDEADYVYMVLFVAEQLGFDIQDTRLAVSGDVAPDDHRLADLRRFARHVEMAEPPAFFNYAFAMAQEPHRFNTLLLLSLCAS